MKVSLPYTQKMALAITLHETGIALMRQKLLREPGDAGAGTPEERLKRWLWRRDDNIPGDVAGPVRVRPTHP